ncbi:hypothetical protein SLA2020_078970 [Shorea laevis]
MAWRYCYKYVLPFTALVTMECVNVGLNTVFKAATMKGMSYHVFMVYAYAIAALVLLPAPFFSLRSRVLPPLSFTIMCKIGLLGLIGSTSQIMGFTGINLSSPALSSAISNLTPAFTFILAIMFRMEKIALKRASSKAKVLGTIISITGAFVVTLYRGPLVFLESAPSMSMQQPLHSSKSNWLFGAPNSAKSNWVIGAIFLTTEYVLVPFWYIVQAQIMKEYPSELTVVFFYNLCVSFIAAIVGLFTERDSSAWRIRPDIALASILCTGLFGSCLNNTVHTWALRLKGPVYVVMFKPLSIAIAVAMGVTFLGDTLYLGSLIGATIISVGFYTLMWGKAKEEIGEDCVEDNLDSTPSNKVPLLPTYIKEQL